MAKTITMRTPMNALPMLLLLMPKLLPSWPKTPFPEILPAPIKKRSRAAERLIKKLYIYFNFILHITRLLETLFYMGFTYVNRNLRGL